MGSMDKFETIINQREEKVMFVLWKNAAVKYYVNNR